MLLKLTRFICAIPTLLSYTLVALPIVLFIGYIMQGDYKEVCKEMNIDFYGMIFEWLLLKDE